MFATRRKASGFPTGKTVFLEALGQQVFEAGMRVAWFRGEDLGALMRALRSDLIVIDDMGLLAVGTDAAYEKQSIAVSSNFYPAGFDELVPQTLATATVDRLLHHTHVCCTPGDSIRLTRALAGKGVTAMS